MKDVLLVLGSLMIAVNTAGAVQRTVDGASQIPAEPQEIMVNGEIGYSVNDQAGCVSGRTVVNGGRVHCNTRMIKISAPDGFAFVPGSIKWITVVSQGSGDGCLALTLKRITIGLGQYVVAASSTGNARSNWGAFRSGGRVECKLSGVYKKIE